MYTLMRDPVTLPASRAVVDRSTIKSHLLSDTKDPFNRMPLKLEEVIPSMFRIHCSFESLLTLCATSPDVELKQRIDAFLAERRNKNTALDKPAEDVVHMDVSQE